MLPSLLYLVVSGQAARAALASVRVSQQPDDLDDGWSCGYTPQPYAFPAQSCGHPPSPCQCLQAPFTLATTESSAGNPSDKSVPVKQEVRPQTQASRGAGVTVGAFAAQEPAEKDCARPDPVEDDASGVVPGSGNMNSARSSRRGFNTPGVLKHDPDRQKLQVNDVCSAKPAPAAGASTPPTSSASIATEGTQSPRDPGSPSRSAPSGSKVLGASFVVEDAPQGSGVGQKGGVKGPSGGTFEGGRDGDLEQLPNTGMSSGELWSLLLKSDMSVQLRGVP